MRDKNIAESVNSCDFLTNKDGSTKLSKTHKYYTQIVSQMATTNIKKCFFVVWTEKDLHVEIVPFDKDHWMKVVTNLRIFYKTFVCPALLQYKATTFCAKWDEILLEENEIPQNEKHLLNSIQCDICIAWFHFKCENIPNIENTDCEWICTNCLMSLA